MGMDLSVLDIVNSEEPNGSLGVVNINTKEKGKRKMECRIEPLEAFTPADFEKMDLKSPDPTELAKRLEACDSVVTKDGDWKYDKVPSDLVQEILAFLWNASNSESDKR